MRTWEPPICFQENLPPSTCKVPIYADTGKALGRQSPKITTRKNTVLRGCFGGLTTASGRTDTYPVFALVARLCLDQQSALGFK